MSDIDWKWYIGLGYVLYWFLWPAKYDPLWILMNKFWEWLDRKYEE